MSRYREKIFIRHLYPALLQLFLVWMLWLPAGSVFAAADLSPETAFRHYTVQEGLSQTSVTAIVQDSKGFMWFGTYDGLNKFDGLQFTAYTHDPQDSSSLSHNFINSLHVDRRGVLWVGTKYGLNIYDGEKNRFIPLLPSNKDSLSLSDPYITALAEDSQGNIWVGTQTGLNQYDPQAQVYLNAFSGKEGQALRKSRISALCTDSGGRLWVGTFGSGLYRHQSEGQFQSFREQTAHLYIKSIEEGPDQKLWLATHHSGLFIFDPETATLQPLQDQSGKPADLSTDYLTDLLNASSSGMWIGSAKGLNIKFEKGDLVQLHHDRSRPSSLIDDHIYALYEDHCGGMWLGTKQGVSYYNPQVQRFRHFSHRPGDSNSLSHPVVLSIFDESDSGTWVGTLQGLTYINGKRKHFRHFRHDSDDPQSLADDAVWSVLRDQRGELWVGTDGGLDRFDPSQEIFRTFLSRDSLFELSESVRVRHIFEDSRQNLWISTAGSGLYRIDSARQHIQNFRQNEQLDSALPGDYVKLVYEDRHQNLWVGTSNGLGLFDPEQESFRQFTHNRYDTASLSNKVVFAITEDSAGHLWIGTAGGGLNRLSDDLQSFRSYRENNGLPNDVVYSILPEGKGKLWITTNNGLSCFDTQSESFRNYDVSDGLQSNEFVNGAYDQNAKGEMFIGGVNGMNVFHPDSLADNPLPLPVVITGFYLYNKKIEAKSSPVLRRVISETETIELTHKQDFFSFEFISVNYTAPQKLLYAYQLEGFDEQWNYVGSRRLASYTAVPPGEYVFKVKAGTNEGIWNEQGQQLKVIIHPPFWGRWWFRLLTAIVLLGSIFAWNTYRTVTIRRQKKLLARQVKERTAEVNLQKEEIRMQYEILEHIYKELQDKNKSLNTSIAYARKIQEASLPPPEALKQLLRESFILFGPREAVSGDFFWFRRQAGKTLVACADCTGHGVPGAFMSMMGSTMLNHIVGSLEVLNPGRILEHLHHLIRQNLRQEQTHNHDGMDISLCVIDEAEGKVEFAGAKNTVVYVQNGELRQLKGERYSIGGVILNADRQFTTHSISLEEDTTFYLFTDGYIDQFGGPQGRKFMAHRLRALLEANYRKPMDEQKAILTHTFNKWTGPDFQQVDDVLVMGFRVKAAVRELSEQ